MGNWEAVRSTVSGDSCVDYSKMGFVGIPVFPAEILLGRPSAELFRPGLFWLWGFCLFGWFLFC